MSMTDEELNSQIRYHEKAAERLRGVRRKREQDIQIEKSLAVRDTVERVQAKLDEAAAHPLRARDPRGR